MKRKAVYSRARRARSSETSQWVGDRTFASGTDWDFPQEPSLLSQGWKKFRAFCGRHDRILLTAASVLLCLGVVYAYLLAQPKPQHLTQTDIDGAVNYTLEHRPVAPAEAAIAASIIAPSVVKVEGFVSDEEYAKILEEKKKAEAEELKKKQEEAKKAGKPLPPVLTDPVRPAPPEAQQGAPGAPGGQPPQQQQAQVGPDREPDSIGSGVIIDDTGRILTNLHVVSTSATLVVVFADGTRSEADVVNVQPENDLAVIKPKVLPDDMKPATLASTAGLHQGDLVVATGFPFGIGPSTSAGVVSGLRRELMDGDKAKLSNLIQFDAAVNPGNSGGPLVDRKGEVLGIVTAIYNPTGQRVFSGIGFAVPIESAARGAGENPL
jgi:S1-C subfamily serine protease